MLMCGLWPWRACIAVHNTLSPPPPDSANGWKKPTVSCVAGKGKEGGEGWGRGEDGFGANCKESYLDRPWEVQSRY